MRRLLGDGIPQLRMQLMLSRTLWLPMAVTGVVLPVGFAAEFAWALGQEQRFRVIAGAVVLSSLILTLAQTGTSPADDRVHGRRAVLHVNGATAVGYLIGLTGDALVRVVYPILVGWIAALVLGVPIPPVGVWLVILVLCVAALAGAGFLLSTLVATPEAVNLVINLCVVVSLAFTPLFYGPEQTPGWLAPVVRWLPTTLAADGIDNSWRSGGAWGLDLLAVAVWCVALTALGWWRVRRRFATG